MSKVAQLLSGRQSGESDRLHPTSEPREGRCWAHRPSGQAPDHRPLSAPGPLTQPPRLLLIITSTPSSSLMVKFRKTKHAIGRVSGHLGATV